MDKLSDEDLETLLKRSSRLINTDGRAEGSDIYQANALVRVLLYDCSIKPRDFRISDGYFDFELRQLLGNLDPEGDIVRQYRDEIGKRKAEYGKAEWDSYDVVFPLNLDFEYTDELQEWDFRGIHIKEISKESWENLVPVTEANLINESKEVRLHMLPLFSKSPNSFEDMTYWKTEHEAHEPGYVVSEANDIITSFLGKINLSLRYENDRYREINQSIWRKGRSEILPPFVYILLNNREIVDIQTHPNATPRETVEIKSRERKKFENLMNYFPDFGSDKSKKDRVLISSLKLFQRGMTEPDQSVAFLEFWRCLETLTQSESGDTSKDIIERGAKFLSTNEDIEYERRYNILIEVRNNIVHQGAGVSVNQSDISLLKQICEPIFNLYSNPKLTHWNLEDYEFAIKDAHLNQNRLRHLQKIRERKIEDAEHKLDLLHDIERILK